MTDAPLPDLSGAHRLDTGGATTSEPVRIAHLVTTALYALAGAGWLVVPDRTIDLIGTIVVLLLSTVGAELARARVSPSGRITLDTIRGLLRAEVYAELNRLAGAQPDAAPPLVDDVQKGT